MCRDFYRCENGGDSQPKQRFAAFKCPFDLNFIPSHAGQISLHDEVRTVEKSRAELEKVVLSAVSHLRSLNQARQALLQDLSDKVQYCIVKFDMLKLIAFAQLPN